LDKKTNRMPILIRNLYFQKYLLRAFKCFKKMI
jgi:hypothetical protein